MFRKPAQLSCALLILAGIAPAQKGHKEADEPLPFQFQTCPCKAEIGDQAVLDLPKGYLFIDRENVGKFLEFNHNIPDRDELGAVLPANGKWFALYSFQDVGYVRDDEKTKLDPDALLKTMTEATEAGNEERVRRGWGRMRVVGWDQKPYYEERSDNLEWGIIVGNDEGGRSVNHRSRVLGRRGVMSVNLVGSPEDMASNLTAFRTMSNGFSY